MQDSRNAFVTVSPRTHGSATIPEQASGAPALGPLLRRWPADCRVVSRSVAPSGLSLNGPCIVLMQSGSLWIRKKAGGIESLQAGSLALIHDPRAVELLETLPEDLPEQHQFAPLPDPMNPPVAIVAELLVTGSGFLSTMLPAVSVITPRGDADDPLSLTQAALKSALRQQWPAEVIDAQAGVLYLAGLANLLESRPRDVIWLTGLFDPEIGPVAAAMLEDPTRNWTVESLADVGNMSRSAFARKFRDLMGTAPIDFLVEVRMWKAARRLKQQSQDLKTIAREAGYLSPAAFSVAFKRWSGATPSDYRRPDDL